MKKNKLPKDTPIGVIGAGTMGRGIAQVAATHGHPVTVIDVSEAARQSAQESLQKILARQVEKGRMPHEESVAILQRIRFSDDFTTLRDCGMLIEAVVEELAVKHRVFQQVENVVSADCLLATNTSSLSVTAIAATCEKPGRVIGTHFFNPAPLMPLVEIVSALQTSSEVVTSTRRLMDSWGKTTVLAKDTPGFIVNRVARPFYGEALRILEENIADVATIDWAVKEIGGFRMGPFELMDLIGNDVNLKVTETVFEAFFYDPRFKPSFTQKRMVEAGLLGRKTGRGYYDYRERAKNPEPTKEPQLGEEIFFRILVMLINEAVDAVFMNIATVEDVDLAMTRGVNYPKGLLRWADEIELARVLAELEALQEEYGEDRYRPNPLLKRMVREGRRFYG